MILVTLMNQVTAIMDEYYGAAGSSAIIRFNPFSIIRHIV